MIIKKLGRRAVLGLSTIALAAGMLGSSVSMAQDVTIPIIVKDTTSFYWQIVLAGARAAGEEFGVNVPELGAQAETDINGQISILENAVSGSPAAIVIAPTERSAKNMRSRWTGSARRRLASIAVPPLRLPSAKATRTPSSPENSCRR